VHITKFACIGHRCKVVQYPPHDFAILYVEGYGSTAYRNYWTTRQVRLAVSMVVFKESLRRSAQAVAPSCPECGRGTFDGRDCHECGYFTH
jgi:hypothetical protein